MDEKRRFSRLSFDAETALTVNGEQVVCKLIDISFKGVLLTIPAYVPLLRGQQARLDIRLNGNDAVISMNVTAAHITGDRIGFYCREIDADSMTHLRRLIELNLGDAELVNRELTQLGARDADDA